MITELISEEKERVINTKLANDHKLIKDKWFGVKSVLDFIYEKIPPLSSGEIVVDLRAHNFNSIIFESVLNGLLDEKITTYRNPSSPVVFSSAPISNYFNGSNFVIKNFRSFKNYRDEISSFCNFILDDGNKRFQSFYLNEEINKNNNDDGIEKITKNVVDTSLKKIPQREQKILKMRYGLLDGVPHTLEEVGQEFEETRENIKKIESESLSIIKKSISNSNWNLFKNIINNSGNKNNFNNKKLKEVKNNTSDLDDLCKINTNGNEKIKRFGKDATPSIGSIELSREILKILFDMRGSDGAMFGVFGKWGRGKTFLINEIKKRIKEDKRKDNFIVVDFNAWKYQDTPALWAYLYQTLLEEFLGKKTSFDEDKISCPWKNNFFKILFTLYNWICWASKEIKIRSFRLFRCMWLEIRRYGRINFISTLLFIFLTFFLYNRFLDFSDVKNLEKYKDVWPLIPVIISSIPLIKFFYSDKTVSRLIKELTSRPGFIETLGIQHKIQKELEILLRTFIEHSGRYILLIIDDVDRCQEGKIINIMDSLKIMLDNLYIQKRIVAIAAIDENILIQVVKNKYESLFKEDEIEDRAKEYLDKLFLCGIGLGDLTAKETLEILENICKIDDRSGLYGNRKINQINPEESTNIKEIKIISTNNKGTELYKDKMVPLERDALNTFINGLGYTPRQIDILVFRYLLARNLLEVFRIEPYKLSDFIYLGKNIVDYTKNQNKLTTRDPFDKIVKMVVPY